RPLVGVPARRPGPPARRARRRWGPADPGVLLGGVRVLHPVGLAAQLLPAAGPARGRSAHRPCAAAAAGPGSISRAVWEKEERRRRAWSSTLLRRVANRPLPLLPNRSRRRTEGRRMGGVRGAGRGRRAGAAAAGLGPARSIQSTSASAGSVGVRDWLVRLPGP